MIALDISMPEMSGIEVLSKIRETEKKQYPKARTGKDNDGNLPFG